MNKIHYFIAIFWFICMTVILYPFDVFSGAPPYWVQDSANFKNALNQIVAQSVGYESCGSSNCPFSVSSPTCKGTEHLQSLTGIIDSTCYGYSTFTSASGVANVTATSLGYWSPTGSSIETPAKLVIEFSGQSAQFLVYNYYTNALIYQSGLLTVAEGYLHYNAPSPVLAPMVHPDPFPSRIPVPINISSPPLSPVQVATPDPSGVPIIGL